MYILEERRRDIGGCNKRYVMAASTTKEPLITWAREHLPGPYHYRPFVLRPDGVWMSKHDTFDWLIYKVEEITSGRWPKEKTHYPAMDWKMMYDSAMDSLDQCQKAVAVAVDMEADMASKPAVEDVAGELYDTYRQYEDFLKEKDRLLAHAYDKIARQEKVIANTVNRKAKSDVYWAQQVARAEKGCARTAENLRHATDSHLALLAGDLYTVTDELEDVYEALYAARAWAQQTEDEVGTLQEALLTARLKNERLTRELEEASAVLTEQSEFTADDYENLKEWVFAPKKNRPYKTLLVTNCG